MIEFILAYKQAGTQHRLLQQACRLPTRGDFTAVDGTDLILRVDWRYMPLDGSHPVINCSVACEEHAALWRELLTYDHTNNWT
jgi:hypothetical protein